ncbi:hypothetical protein PT285_00920 [Lactobacillus sp. ESL0791]|uniref:hypothetical protein n=1 Tax=Lactobacillus sp. ESL0791 TaxID=2983234 RepID=UPI0023F76958|nr:hypothetical protein [Lactobacillus sp. ESL0791]MDF7638000.1 hypothetical protein [Lactobacillus sp. ESL0791]
MMRYKGLTWVYLGIQCVLDLVAVFFVSANFYTNGMQFQLLLAALLLVTDCILGTYFAIRNLRTPTDQAMKVMSYAPLLIFALGGLVLVLGVALMLLASYLRYKYRP